MLEIIACVRLAAAQQHPCSLPQVLRLCAVLFVEMYNAGGVPAQLRMEARSWSGSFRSMGPPVFWAVRESINASLTTLGHPYRRTAHSTSHSLSSLTIQSCDLRQRPSIAKLPNRHNEEGYDTSAGGKRLWKFSVSSRITIRTSSISHYSCTTTRTCCSKSAKTCRCYVWLLWHRLLRLSAERILRL